MITSAWPSASNLTTTPMLCVNVHATKFILLFLQGSAQPPPVAQLSTTTYPALAQKTLPHLGNLLKRNSLCVKVRPLAHAHPGMLAAPQVSIISGGRVEIPDQLLPYSGTKKKSVKQSQGVVLGKWKPSDEEKKHLTILDATGHKRFVLNMVVLLKLIWLYCKMDAPAVNWSSTRYKKCKEKLVPFLNGWLQSQEDTQFMPSSGLTRANLKHQLDKCNDMGTVALGKLESRPPCKGQHLVATLNKHHVKVLGMFLIVITEHKCIISCLGYSVVLYIHTCTEDITVIVFLSNLGRQKTRKKI
ncbi:Eukaryotic peptide chain release factor GTP-binding subunit ERF3A [Galemys pyrenaicus]|uniref:Eukaryotic peptide chain release factor GTP-binding subunit ERF3A n=1 Tax=Galemys pyrenaicus TaxID=202257 RepID=A0A8J6A2C5_GALPY|nr:Eukaryotic peptide chain release factor GTP-binding subunit ERF3A [Galemys pyrenaicus]